MKKFLLPLLFVLLALPGFSQLSVYISGYVTDSATGYAIPNHAVTIASDSTGGVYYYKTVYTNSNGWYADTIPTAVSNGSLYVTTYDCVQDVHEVILDFNPSNVYFTVSFNICNTPPPCEAFYFFSVYPGGLVYFYDYSSGNPTSWFWDFGDGGTSTLQNPVHQYAVSGYYTAYLTITAASTGCTSTFSNYFYVNVSSGGCQASFYTIADSLDSHTVHFIDMSSGNISTWVYHFGDGTSQTITSPASPNVTHTYQGASLAYIACLTVTGVDSNCYDYHCDTILINSSQGCIANFAYSNDPNQITPTQFTDLSQTNGGGPITSWYWNFDDPESGVYNYSSVQNPTHLFATPGAHNVCLTIHGADSSCYDTKCKTLYVNSTPSGCTAMFVVYPDSANTPPYSYSFIDESAGNIISWSWSFGDGMGSDEQFPHHTYSQQGVYYVCLTIHGADSACYDVACDTLFVGNQGGCQAYFNFTPSPANGLTAIQFNDYSSGNPEEWYWNFGDSTFSGEQNPMHIYSAPGVYYVCLTISKGNCADVFCRSVNVEDTTSYHTVYGKVLEGNYPLGSGIALIFSIDTSQNYLPYIDVCNIDSMGYYHFNSVPDGNYLIYAIPLDSNGYLPTYYGDKLIWPEATVIALGEPANPYYIHLIPSGTMPDGPGSIGGQVNVGKLKSTVLDKMTMLLMNEEKQAITFVMVDGSGSFDFSSLGYGTYYLHAELSGITSDYVKVVLTPETPHADVVMTFEGKNVLGIDYLNPGLEAGIIYPNPATDKCNLVLDLEKANTVRADIVDMKGMLVSRTVLSAAAGRTLLTITVSGIDPGFYTLIVTPENGNIISRKLIIAK